MAKEAQATGTIKGHRLTIRQDAWPLSDGEVIVTVRKVSATRSIQQNRWYWGKVVGLVAQHTGLTADEVHEIYKAKFLPRVVEIIDSRGDIAAEFVVGGSTRQLDKIEFAEYCEAIREWAATVPKVTIPDPDPELRTT
jgi:hypothetical protein